MLIFFYSAETSIQSKADPTDETKTIMSSHKTNGKHTIHIGGPPYWALRLTWSDSCHHFMSERACVRACVRVCVRACVRVCNVCAYVRVRSVNYGKSKSKNGQNILRNY